MKSVIYDNSPHPLAWTLAFVSFAFGLMSLLSLFTIFMPRSSLFGLAFITMPLASVLATIAGWWAKNQCRRNPDAEGLGLALAGIICGYLSLLIWYALHSCFWFYWVPAVAIVGITVILLLGIILALLDGSRFAAMGALATAVVVLLLTATLPRVAQSREAARRQTMMKTLRDRFFHIEFEE